MKLSPVLNFLLGLVAREIKAHEGDIEEVLHKAIDVLVKKLIDKIEPKEQ